MKFLSYAAASALIATTATLVASSAPEEELFDSFITKFNKPYKHDNVERAKRFSIFKRNLQVAAEQNKKNPHATFGVNLFSDLSEAEFKTYHNAEKVFEGVGAQLATLPKLSPKIKNLKDAPFDLDWRKKGAVTGVKNQGQCGSCWSFSTTGAIEGQWFLAGHPLTSVSEEFFVDCDTVDQGCNGGLPSDAIKWVVGFDGGKIPTEKSYPYTAGGGQAGKCRTTGWTVGAIIQGQRAVDSNEPAMWAAAAGDGPISIGVDATTWQTYAGGIMTDCNGRQLDHGVLIVGFDLSYTTPYWIIKNSWTTQWGENGYIRVEYGTNQCGLTTAPILPVVNMSSVPTPAPLPPTQAPTPAPPTTQAPPTPDATGWMNLFPPPGESYLSESMGISMLGPRDVYLIGMVAGSGPNIGPQVAHFDGNVQGNFYTLNHQGNLPFLEMEVAIGGNPMAPKGAVCGVEYPIIDKSPFAYLVNSTTVAPSTVNGAYEFMSVVQGCEASADGNYIIGADQGSSAGSMQALLSTDGGKTFTPRPFGNAPIAQPNCTFPRYADVASENVMYVTLGDWGNNNTQVSAHWQNMQNIKNGVHEYQLTATRKRVRDPKTGKTKTVFTGPLDVYMANKKAAASGVAAGSSGSGSDYCGNSAEILRSADGGRTWTSVFSSVDKFYFNEIACASENNCVAVGEGFQDADAGVRIYQTMDGINWSRVFFQANTEAASYSFFSVEVADSFKGEYWVGASKQLPGRKTAGLFFHSTDFGKTWSEYKHGIPSLVEIVQISFSAESFGTVGYAVALDQFQGATILRWDLKGQLPAQTYFTQKTCFIAGCEAACQSIQFPQRLCIRANGGGAVEAYVDGENLVQTLYETTTCTGKGKQSTIPLNKCMKNSQGQYFEFTTYTGVSASSKASSFHMPKKSYNPNTDKLMTL